MHPHAAVLDVHMPGVGGCEVAARLRAADPPPLLVALTGVDDADARGRTAAAGFDLHLPKGAALDPLLDALAAAAGRPG